MISPKIFQGGIMRLFKKLGLTALVYAGVVSTALASPITVYNMTSNPVRFSHTLCSSDTGICRMVYQNKLDARTSSNNEIRIVLPIDHSVNQFIITNAELFDKAGGVVKRLNDRCVMSKDTNFVLLSLDADNELVCQHG